MFLQFSNILLNNALFAYQDFVFDSRKTGIKNPKIGQNYLFSYPYFFGTFYGTVSKTGSTVIGLIKNNFPCGYVLASNYFPNASKISPQGITPNGPVFYNKLYKDIYVMLIQKSKLICSVIYVTKTKGLAFYKISSCNNQPICSWIYIS